MHFLQFFFRHASRYFFHISGNRLVPFCVWGADHSSIPQALTEGGSFTCYFLFMTPWPFQSHMLCLRSRVCCLNSIAGGGHILYISHSTSDDATTLSDCGSCLWGDAATNRQSQVWISCVTVGVCLADQLSAFHRRRFTWLIFSVKRHRHCVTLVSFATNSQKQWVTNFEIARGRPPVVFKIHSYRTAPLFRNCIFASLHCYLGWTRGVDASAACSHTVQGSHRVYPK